MTTSDSELLQQFARDRSEDAFATLVKRHVDLVYSAALRQVCSSQLAEDVSQSVFLDLSRNTAKLKPDTILTAWLYRVTRRTAIDVVRTESRRKLREQIAVELADMNSPDTHWDTIAPLLDEAMETLDEDERSSILLRYFKNKSLREVGKILGTSDDAAQKRVSRAVERLREYFSKNGITVGSGGFVALLSANAVQSAPMALSATISSAAALGLAIKTTGTIAAGKTLIMTTTQKALIATTLAAALGTGVYELAQNSRLQNDLQRMDQKFKPLADENEQLHREWDKAAAELALAKQENDRLQRATSELPKLRGDSGRLQQSQQELAKLKADGKTHTSFADRVARMVDDPDYKKHQHDMMVTVAKGRYASLFKEMNLTPEEKEKVINLRADQETLNQEKIMALLDGGDLAQLQKEMAVDREKFDTERISLLGAERFQQLKDYENSVADRIGVGQVMGELGKKNPLSDDQAKQLREIMIQERAKNPPLANRDDAENRLEKFDAEWDQIFFQAQEQMNEQVRLRSAAFLSPEQIEALSKAQAKNLVEQKKMSKQIQSLFGDKTH